MNEALLKNKFQAMNILRRHSMWMGFLIILSCNIINPANNTSDNGLATCLAICSDSFGIYQIQDAQGIPLGSIGGDTPIQFNGSFSIINNANASTLIQQNFLTGEMVLYNSYGQYSAFAGTTINITVNITRSTAGTTTSFGPFTLSMVKSQICGSTCGVTSQTFSLTLP